MQKQHTSFQRWMSTAIYLCLAALILNLTFAAGYVLGKGFIATLSSALFAIDAAAVGGVVIVYFASIAFPLTTRPYRIERMIAGIALSIVCILLILLIAINLSHLGNFTGGDALLMQAEILIVGYLFWRKVRQRSQRQA
jgi:hypothetical protein